jgi:hypothetical protein
MIARIIEIGASAEREAAAWKIIAVAAGVLLLIGFICGYGVRASISHWHRVKARRHFERMAEDATQRGEQNRLAITFQRGDSTRAPPDG